MVEQYQKDSYNKDTGECAPSKKEVTHHEEAGRERKTHSPLRKAFPR